MDTTRNVALKITLVAVCAWMAAVGRFHEPRRPRRPCTTVLRFGSVWDGTKVTRNAVVVVEGDRVKSVGSGTAVPANAKVIDLSRYYGVPGLIDAHTHITYWADATPRPGVRPTQTSMALPTAVRVFMAQENARKSLEAGFTTVRDLGAQEYADLAMRDLINRGAMPGPRIFGAGYGLHVTNRAPRAGEVLVPTGGEANGPAEVMKAVREQIAAGADVIKMFGSVGGFDNVNTNQTFGFEEMKAAVETAHAYGKKIAIHSYGASGARDAARAGPDSIEHAVDVDEATLKRWRRRTSSTCRPWRTTRATGTTPTGMALPPAMPRSSPTTSTGTRKRCDGRSRRACGSGWGPMPCSSAGARTRATCPSTSSAA